MRIKGEDGQGNLRRFLSIQESRESSSKFFCTLLNMQNEDPDRFFCTCVKITDEQYAFIISNHPNHRLNRTYMTKQTMQDRCVELLQNPFIGAAVTENPIILDDNGQCIPAMASSNGQTAIVDEINHTVLLFEAGFQYIRLVTIWNTMDRKFYIDEKARVIKLKSNGFLECNIKNIPEIKKIKNFSHKTYK